MPKQSSVKVTKPFKSIGELRQEMRSEWKVEPIEPEKEQPEFIGAIAYFTTIDACIEPAYPMFVSQRWQYGYPISYSPSKAKLRQVLQHLFDNNYVSCGRLHYQNGKFGHDYPKKLQPIELAKEKVKGKR